MIGAIQIMFGFGKKDSAEDKWANFEQEALPHKNDLFRTAVWLTRDHHAAEELVQEVMFQALRSFHLYEPGTNCKAWLFRILYNHNARRISREMKFSIVDDPDEVLLGSIPFEAQVPQTLTDEEIIQALWRLPIKYRDVVILADLEELKYKEVSSILGLPIGTVMSRLSRARKALRTELQAYARELGYVNSRSVAGG